MTYNPRILELHTPEQLRAELIRVGAESSELDEHAARATFRIVKLQAVSLTLARLLYQELVMEGGQVVTAARLDHRGPGSTDVLLCGTRYQLQHLIIRLRWQESDELILLANDLEQVLDHYDAASSRGMTIGPALFEWGERTYVMGIVNVTPDSFTGDGLIQLGDTEADYVARALSRARTLVTQGTDILDVGGESTHPDAMPVDEETELARVVPVVRALAREVGVPISVDTYKARVASAALDAGAHLVNDVRGLRGDPEMKRVVADYGVPVVLMHSAKRRISPRISNTRLLAENWSHAEKKEREDFLGDIIEELRAQIEVANEAGIRSEKLLIDPGLGFGKSVAQNLEILNRLGEFKSLGLPILIGPSRKGFIRRTAQVLDEERDDASEEGTAAAIALGIARGADLIRVHAVKAMARVARMTDAIVRARSQIVSRK